MKSKVRKNLINIIIVIAISIPLSLANINLHMQAEDEHKEIDYSRAYVPDVEEQEPVMPDWYEAVEEDHDSNYKELDVVVSEEDLYYLAHLLNGEAGASWCSDEMVYLVGCVVLNRVKSDKFPNTLKEVILEKGQYASVLDGNFDKEPTDRCWEIAEELLTYGSDIPEDVVYQAEFKQGSSIYKHVQNMYFCKM